MTETRQASDLAMGIALFVGLIAILGAFATAMAAYLALTQDSLTMQHLSGVGLSIAIGAGILVIAALHIFE